MTGNLETVHQDPTLEAVHRAVEAAEAAKPPRGYLGASSLGDLCQRRAWYQYQNAPAEPWKAETIYKFIDGHATEAVIIERLRMVPGVQVWDRDEATGEQIGGSLFDGKFGYHADGVVKGLLQAPVTPHVLEVKAVNPKKFQDFLNKRDKFGEKQTLTNWDYGYYVQALLYMHLLDLPRHYLIVATPGGREMASCRTEAVPVHAKALLEKAERLVNAKGPPVRVMDNESYYLCKFCRFKATCYSS